MPNEIATNVTGCVARAPRRTAPAAERAAELEPRAAPLSEPREELQAFDTMKITRIETFLLKAPLGEQRFWSSQTSFPERKSLLVRVDTDAGLSGWGEAGQYGPAEPVASQIHDVFAPMLLGKEAVGPAVHWDRMYTQIRDFGAGGAALEAISGLDIALWDLLGQVHRAPVFELLGGAFRRTVETYATGLYYRGPNPADLTAALAQVREEAGRYREQGFPAVKAKIGLLRPPDDLRRLAAIREAIGDEMLLMVDANHAYNTHVACSVARELEQLAVYWFEEPVVPEDLEGYRRVRASTTIAIAGGECEHTRYGFARWFAAHALDIAQPDPTTAGGLTELARIAATASAFHVQCMPHVWGSGIALAAGLQFLATVPPAPYTASPEAPYNEPLLEWDANPNPLRTELLQEPIMPNEGKVPVPDGPGLGIHIDKGAVARYTVARRRSE